MGLTYVISNFDFGMQYLKQPPSHPLINYQKIFFCDRLFPLS